MTDSNPPTGDHELNKLIAEFIQAIENGESPDREKLKRENPGFAKRLQAFFDDFDLLPTKFNDRKHHDQPTQIGPYTLVEKIGEGGMGSVWLARQTRPVKRKVAIKLIKPGMDSKQVLARFEAERQALALMDHPNIAKVLDGGVTADGQPYFVMELVKGTPITEFCDDQKLTPSQRLELLVPVCRAIQHAHQKGIIHRDIKPNNVLVALYDDQPVPKVIDFGVAKATGGTLTDETIETNFGAVVGTLEYMSPEQATANNLDIDTRSDVYSLGVLLYELLVGSTPFKKKELMQKGMLEVLRTIREDEPSRPSVKLSSSETIAVLSAQRSMDPSRLTELLRSELDWIVMKSLEKNRSRRYETANEMASDIRRYLSGEPVLAHPPGRVYRFQKFFNKNRGPIIAASVVVLAMLIGTAGLAWGLVQANQSAEAERLAKSNEERKRVEADEQRQIAQDESLRNLAFKNILRRVVEENSASDARRLEQAINLVDEIHAKTFDGFGRLSSAPMTEWSRHELKAKDPLGPVPIAMEIRDAFIASLGTGHPSTRRAMLEAAELCRLSGDEQDSIKLFEELRDEQERFEVSEDEKLDTLNGLASAYYVTGKIPEALAMYEEILKQRIKHSSNENPDSVIAMNNLGTALLFSGNFEKAAEILEEAYIASGNVNGQNHTDTITSIASLASAYARIEGKQEKAESLYLEAATQVEKIGFRHQFAELIISNTIGAFEKSTQWKEAEQWQRKWVEEVVRIRGKDSVQYRAHLSRLGSILVKGESWEDAETVTRECLSKCRQTDPDHWLTYNAMSLLGHALLGQKKYKEAEPLLLDGFEGMVARVKTKRGAAAESLLPDVADRLVALYQAIDDQEKLKEWKAERAKYKK